MRPTHSSLGAPRVNWTVGFTMAALPFMSLPRKVSGPLSCVLVCVGCGNKAPQTGQLESQKCVVVQFWSPESKVRMSAGLNSPEASRLGLQMATFALSLHRVAPRAGVCVCVLSS